ncbi:aminopeptidase N [Hahella sp. CCB-MM4]|uniref:aminopeptidase N n=1 Tax=Hahella sp. (strain CCB-MM4) TaxID=1926491 RepID=UPI000B9B34F3|nr:aminopeptidase N [Hahella sp. CCB-MM4]OZG74006.1 aminopeptidase N [Hahella sp. CCB-MM4]
MKESQPRTIYLKDYRPPNFIIDETHLRFQLYEDGARVTSHLHIRRNPEAVDFQNVLRLDGVELELQHLVLDGRELQSNEYQLDDEGITLERLPKAFVLNVVTWIKPQENTCLEGLYRSSSMFCTQCEAEGFRRITYYLDRPDVMSKFTTTIEAEKARYPVLLSNGNPIENGESEDRHWMTWEDPFKKPCYLFALVAGDLKYVESHYKTMSGRNVQLRIYVEPHDLEKCDHAMDSLKRSMKWDEEVYGREYDLDIFNIVAVSDFNMGAMENKGLNIFNSSCVLANPKTATDATFQRVEAIVAHEYFHNWSGNRVTCRDWFQLSLKEGFTVFRDSEFSADMHSHAVKRVEDVNLLRTAQFAEDGGPMAHSVRPDSYMEISNFYTLTVYEKGAEVVRMLHTLLGAEKFREGTDLYFERHDGQAVTTDDFVACMEEVSQRDLSQFRRWYTQSGTPRVSVTDEYDEERQQYRLTVKQSCPPTPGQDVKEPFHIPMKLGLVGDDGKDISIPHDNGVIEITDSEQSFDFQDIPSRPVPSLFRHFSAPVKIDYSYSRDQLRFLMSHDSDGFNRWDAGQRLATGVLNDMAEAARAGNQISVDQAYLEAFSSVLGDRGDDYPMLAKMMAVPTLSFLAEQSDTIYVDALVAAREGLQQRLVDEFETAIVERYQELAKSCDNAGTDSRSMGTRSYKNALLMLLASGNGKMLDELAYEQFSKAENMTDELSALAALVTANSPQATTALDSFYQRWHKDALVMESWFSVQAGSEAFGSLAKIEQLTGHPLFSEKNPNKVRSVVGVFAGQNWKQFHQADVSGYEFLADWILKLNKLNPQIASRLVTPLTRWKRFESSRSDAMKSSLERIAREPALSKDVYEVVSKSLK